MAADTLSAKEFGIPSLPPGTPSHLEHLIEELTESLDLDAPSTSYRVLKRTFHFLMGYFADLVQSLSTVFGELEFEADEGRHDPKNAEDTIRIGLEFLASDAPQELPEVKAILAVFYDGKSARKFTRLMGIGGKPRRGMMQLSKLVATTQVPVRKKCVSEVRRYFDFLKEWLEAAAPFFNTAGIVSERTSLEGKQTIIVRIGKQDLTAGDRLELHGCPLCIPEKEIDVPLSLYEREVYFFVPQRSPKHLLEILNRLDEAMSEEDPVKGCLELRNSLEFLIRYFAGVSSKVCEDLDCITDQAQEWIENSQSVSASESLLNNCLDLLRNKPDSLAAKSLVGIFYRRNELFEFLPRWHTEILALHGQLSAWCQLEPGYGELEDPETCKIEFEKHVNTLREWLTSLGAYLESTEHFFEEPSADGSVEFSVRIGDRFIEVGEPGYQLWLNNPRPEGEMAQASDQAPKPLIREPIEIPEGCPGVLRNILTRMDIYLRLGDPVEACISLRDATDYLTRYFAGLAAAAFRELGTLPEEAARMARESLSVHECERLLILSLRSIGRESNERLGLAVRNVFYYQEEFSDTDRPTGAHARILQMDADPTTKMQNLAEFCSLKAGEGILANPARSKREIERFLPSMRDWLAMAEPFFRECTHYEEPPAEDGKTELVIEFEDYYLELVEPDYVFYIRPGADEVPDVEVPELPPPDLELDEEQLVEEPVRRKLSPEEAALERPFLVYRLEHVGERENSKGAKCASGYIILTNAGGGTLSGVAVPTHHSIEVSPVRFRGNKVELSYWVDPEELPEVFEAYLQLKTPDEERTISVYEMQGLQERDHIESDKGLSRLISPLFVGFFFFYGIYALGCYHITQVLTSKLGGNWVNMDLTEMAPAVLGEVSLPIQALGWTYLLMAGLLPISIGKAYMKLPPSAKAVEEERVKRMMMMPIALVFLSLLPLLYPPWRPGVFFHPDTSYMHPTRLFPWYIGFNLMAATYMELSITEKLDDWIHDTIVRQVVPTVLFLGYLMLVQLGLQS